jgi:hypothetical protein
VFNIITGLEREGGEERHLFFLIPCKASLLLAQEKQEQCSRKCLKKQMRATPGTFSKVEQLRATPGTFSKVAMSQATVKLWKFCGFNETTSMSVLLSRSAQNQRLMILQKGTHLHSQCLF